MTRAKVVDASVAAAVIFGEKEAEPWLEAMEGSRLFAPSLLAYELVSVYLKKVKAQPDLAPALYTKLCRFESLGITFRDLASVGLLGELATKTQLSAYDASYLLLAKEIEAELLTMDKALSKAASQ